MPRRTMPGLDQRHRTMPRSALPGRDLPCWALNRSLFLSPSKEPCLALPESARPCCAWTGRDLPSTALLCPATVRSLSPHEKPLPCRVLPSHATPNHAGTCRIHSPALAPSSLRYGPLYEWPAVVLAFATSAPYACPVSLNGLGGFAETVGFPDAQGRRVNRRAAFVFHGGQDFEDVGVATAG